MRGRGPRDVPMRLLSPSRCLAAPLRASAGRHSVLPSLRPRRHLHAHSRLLQRHIVIPSSDFEGTGPRIRDGNIAVIGGGLAGLTTAYYLAKLMPRSTKITIYESGDRLGGWVRTEKFDVDVAGKKGKVRFERGPRTMSTQKASSHRVDNYVLYELVRLRQPQSPDPAADLGLPLEHPRDAARFLYYPDRLLPVPGPPPLPISTGGLLAFILSTLKQVFSSDMLRSMAAYMANLKLHQSHPLFQPKSPPPPDMSIEQWVGQFSSSPQAINAISALMHGIYGGDVSKLSARSALASQWYDYWFSRDMEPNTLIMASSQAPIVTLPYADPVARALMPAHRGTLITFGHYGMQALPGALEHALRSQPNVTIKLNQKVDRIARLKDAEHLHIGVNGNRQPETYDKVIACVPGELLAKLVGPQKVPTLASMHSTSIMLVNLWYPYENIKPRGIGYLIPRDLPEGQNPEHALGVFFDSDVIPNAPDEPTGTKLAVLMGGHYYDRPGVTPPSQEEAIAQAKLVLERHLDIPKDMPCFAVARLAKGCIPQHLVGHHQALETAASDIEKHFGGTLSVVSGTYDAIGIMGALSAGRNMAHALALNRDLWGWTGIWPSEKHQYVVYHPSEPRGRRA
ncbi:hypothetical protein B0I35DRAFT_475287 [Stachybotrys elegans]|uniref:Protoporphyrinogen oxidase n=1 Tax=Stachybotrys elegans TaxID=80388 RepID=A0A8K0T3Y3_9HYPO|nr:hypothetical protein B0I35DRAFT_475287 [Stachybotrys elegans]